MELQIHLYKKLMSKKSNNNNINNINQSILNIEKSHQNKTKFNIN